MTQSRKIAVVGACPYPVPQGSQIYLAECVRTYQQLGHEVHLCVYGYGIGDDPQDITIHRAPSIPFAKRTKAGPSWAKPFQDWRMVSFLKRIIKEHDIDLIDAHNYESLLVAQATGFKPIIYHAHNAMADELPHYPGFGLIGRSIGTQLDQRLPKKSSHVVAPHDRLRDYLIDLGCAPEQVTVIPPSINPTSLDHEKTYSETPSVIYAGNLDSYQNPTLLATVMGRIREQRPDTRCIVATNSVNDLPYAEVIPTPNFDALKLVLQQDAVFLCPRTSWSGYPIKILNAMAAALPVVACESSGYPIIDGLTGHHADDGDTENMAKMCIHLLDDHSMREQMGRSGKICATHLYAQRDMINPIIQQVLT